MISNYSRSAYFLMVGLLVVVLLAAGCTPAAPKSAPAAAPKAAATEPAKPQSQAAKENTAPPAPASTQKVANQEAAVEASTEPATAAPTEASAAAAPSSDATATATPKGQLPQGLSAWCLPEDAAISNASDPLKPPVNAKKAKSVKGTFEIRNLPSNGCVFLYTFDKPAQEGLKLEVYEIDQSKPFLTVDLQPAAGKAETVWAFVRHAMVIAPPTNNISYSFVVRDSQGQQLSSDKMNLLRWVPGTPQPKEKEDCGCSVTLPGE